MRRYNETAYWEISRQKTEEERRGEERRGEERGELISVHRPIAEALLTFICVLYYTIHDRKGQKSVEVQLLYLEY